MSSGDSTEDTTTASVPTLAYDRGTLVVSGDRVIELALDQATFIPSLPGGGCGVQIPATSPFKWDDRTGQWRCHARHYGSVCSAVRGGVQDTLLPPQTVRWPSVQLPELRPDQREALAAWEASGRCGQIIMPTGTGKTIVALAAMNYSKVATLVVAPIRDLMYQWHRRIRKALGFDAGIVGDGRYEIWPVTVTTYASAYIHMERMGERFGLVIFDEEHHLPAPSFRQAAEFCAATWRMGLTATPERLDGQHVYLDELIGPVVYRQELPDARGTTLADYQTVRVPVALRDDEQERYDALSRQIRTFVSNRRKEKPGYRWEDVCKAVGHDPEARRVLRAFHAKQAIETRAAEKLRVLEDLFGLHAHEQVLVFTGSNQMALDVSRRFLIPMIIDKTGKRERQAILDGFETGRLRALVANQVLDEGIDVPAVKIGVVLGGFSSPRQAKQRLGRILRRSGRTTAVLYEVVCEETREELRSRARRRSDAFQGTRRLRL